MADGEDEKERPKGGSGEKGVSGRPLLVVFVIVLVNVIGFGIVIPLLPLYAEEFGASAVVIGLLYGAYGAAQFFGVPVLGYLADRIGRRPVLIASLLGSVVAFVLLGLAGSLLVLFLARILDGVTGGNITTARAVVADVTDEEERAKAFGRISAAFGIGFFVGPALGGVLAGVDPRLPAWIAAALALVAALLTWFFLPETVPEGAEPRGWPWQEARDLLARSVVTKYVLTDLGWWLAFGAYQTAFPLFVAERLGYGATGAGMLLGYFGVVNSLVQFFAVGPTVERIGERAALVVGLVLGGVGVGGAAIAPSLVPVLVALTPASAGIGLSVSALRSLISRTVAPQEQGRLQGVSGSVESLGRGLGPVWGNGLLGLAGAGVAYGSVAAVLLALAGWSTRLPEPDAEKAEERKGAGAQAAG